MLCCLPKHTNRTEKAFAFPWPHEAHLHTTGQHLKKPSLLLVNLLTMAVDQSSTSKAQKKCWQYINPSVSQDPITTFNQCFPYLSRAITPVIVQNAK